MSKKEEKHANETQLEEWREKKEEKSPSVRVLHADGPADARSPARIATVTATERASELHFRLCGRWFGQWRDVDDEAIEVL